jgi:protein-tyrosine-phosphatase
MAEALLREITKGRVDVFSAGSQPRQEIHPLARKVMSSSFHLDLAAQYPKSMDRYLGESFDYVISVCDRAAESCPVFPGDPERIRWSLEDPAEVEGSEAERERAFERTAKDLMARIRIWLALPAVAARAGTGGAGHVV